MSIKNLLHYIVDIFLWGLIIFLIFLLFIVFLDKYNSEDKVLSIGGYAIFNVATGSMMPTLNIGDYILVGKESDYDVGDIVTYKVSDSYITHRIVKKDGNSIITKGDANDTLDSPILYSDIKGKYLMTLTLFNFIYNKYFFAVFIIIVILVNLFNWYLKKSRR